MSDMDFREVMEESEELTPEEIDFDNGIDVEDDKEDGYENHCYICRRPESVTGKMINMYGGIKICNDCLQKTLDTMNSMPNFGVPGFGGPVPGGPVSGGPDATGTNGNNSGPNMNGMPHISMIDMSDLANFFGGPMAGGPDGMFGGIPKSQRLKKKKPKEREKKQFLKWAQDVIQTFVK